MTNISTKENVKEVKRQEIQKLKEKLMKARNIIYKSAPCDVDDSFNHADDCEKCAFLRAVRG